MSHARVAVASPVRPAYHISLAVSKAWFADYVRYAVIADVLAEVVESLADGAIVLGFHAMLYAGEKQVAMPRCALAAHRCVAGVHLFRHSQHYPGAILFAVIADDVIA